MATGRRNRFRGRPWPSTELACARPLGYWDGTLTMVVTAAVFALCLVWMLANLHNPQSVKQFNIVYAAERPLRPETTHFAWHFFAPYRKALGFLTRAAGRTLLGRLRHRHRRRWAAPCGASTRATARPTPSTSCCTWRSSISIMGVL
ncbi:MAG: hypothetical protein MZV65_16045 [Chromatiales bacterium]|nr:hypothetical protein [Chromatiales bacterium]